VRILSNPFEAFKKIPGMDENFVKNISDMSWPPDAMDIINRLGQDKWPYLDILETETELIVLIDLPGLQKSSALLEVNGMTLKVAGELPSLIDHTFRVHRQERKLGEFKRTVALPVAVHNTDIRATYQGGILEVRLMKVTEKSSAKIPIDFME
jgi:HSP20 family protein